VGLTFFTSGEKFVRLGSTSFISRQHVEELISAGLKRQPYEIRLKNLFSNRASSLFSLRIELVCQLIKRLVDFVTLTSQAALKPILPFFFVLEVEIFWEIIFL